MYRRAGVERCELDPELDPTVQTLNPDPQTPILQNYAYIRKLGKLLRLSRDVRETTITTRYVWETTINIKAVRETAMIFQEMMECTGMLGLSGARASLTPH